MTSSRSRLSPLNSISSSTIVSISPDLTNWYDTLGLYKMWIVSMTFGPFPFIRWSDIGSFLELWTIYDLIKEETAVTPWYFEQSGWFLIVFITMDEGLAGVSASCHVCQMFEIDISRLLWDGRNVEYVHSWCSLYTWQFYFIFMCLSLWMTHTLNWITALLPSIHVAMLLNICNTKRWRKPDTSTYIC